MLSVNGDALLGDDMFREKLICRGASELAKRFTNTKGPLYAPHFVIDGLLRDVQHSGDISFREAPLNELDFSVFLVFIHDCLVNPFMGVTLDILKTTCTVLRGGLTAGIFEADTIFIGDIPHVVFDWEQQPDGSEKPAHLVALDPRYFHPMQVQGETKYLYEFPVTDPRALD